MSSESKKKRGEAGAKKGETAQHRLNNLPEDWMARQMGVNQVPADHTGGHMVRGAIGAALVAKAFGFAPRVSARGAMLIDQSFKRCPTAVAVFDSVAPAAPRARAA